MESVITRLPGSLSLSRAPANKSSWRGTKKTSIYHRWWLPQFELQLAAKCSARFARLQDCSSKRALLERAVQPPHTHTHTHTHTHLQRQNQLYSDEMASSFLCSCKCVFMELWNNRSFAATNSTLQRRPFNADLFKTRTKCAATNENWGLETSFAATNTNRRSQNGWFSSHCISQPANRERHIRVSKTWVIKSWPVKGDIQLIVTLVKKKTHTKSDSLLWHTLLFV